MQAEPLPVVRSWINGEGIVASIAQRYALASPVTCRLFQAGSNDTYVVTAGDDARLIARLYRAPRTEEEVAYELELLAHLAARGVPMAVPIATQDGRLALSLLAPEGIRHLVLFTDAPGVPIAWTNPEHCHLAGRLLASFHAAGDELVTSLKRAPVDVAALIDRPLTAIRPYLTGRSSEVAYLETFADKLRTRLLAAVTRGLDWGVCHGDFDAPNVHIGPDHAVRVFDFDRTGPGWRASDFYHVQKVGARRGAAIWDAFLRGYQSRRPRAEADVVAAPLFYGIGLFRSWGRQAENANEQGIRQFREDRIDRWIKSFHCWEADYLDHL